jgi:hypothetical protein
MTKGQKIILLGLGAFGAWYYFTQVAGEDDGSDVSSNSPGLGTTIMAAVQGWKNVNSGPTWVPVLNATEAQYGIPADTLAAVAYQESSFLEGVIRGTTPSSDGLSLGIMQLQTQYYPALVGPDVAVPYQDSDVEAQIDEAGQVFANNYAALGSWPQTIAAWNQGLSGVQQNGITSVAYVNKILANAPAANV